MNTHSKLQYTGLAVIMFDDNKWRTQENSFDLRRIENNKGQELTCPNFMLHSLNKCSTIILCLEPQHYLKQIFWLQ